MKMPIVNRARLGAVITGVVAVLIIAAIITATAVLANPDKTEPQGVMSSEELQAVPMAYSSATDKYIKDAFKTYFDNLFKNLFQEFGITQTASSVVSPDAIADLFLEAFKNGGVSADKVLAFADYLENADVEDLVKNVLIAYLSPELDESGNPVYNEKGEPVFVFDEDKNLGAILAQYANPVDAVKDIVENTSITAEEAGNVFYYILLNSTDTEYKSTLEKLGADGFNTLFIDSVEIYETLTGVSEGVTLADIRAMRELLNAQGVQYNEIIEKVGLSTVADFISGAADTKEWYFDSEYGDVLTEVLNKTSEITPFLLCVVSDVMVYIPADATSALDDWLNADDKVGKAYCQITMSKLVVSALEKAAEKTGKPVDDALTELAKVAAGIKYLSGISENSEPEISDWDTYTKEFINSFKSDYDIVKELAAADVASYKEAENLTDNEIAGYLALSEKFSSESAGLGEGAERISSLVFYNMFVSIIVNLYS